MAVRTTIHNSSTSSAPMKQSAHKTWLTFLTLTYFVSCRARRQYLLEGLEQCHLVEEWGQLEVHSHAVEHLYNAVVGMVRIGGMK